MNAEKEKEINDSIDQYYKDKQKEKSELIYCDLNKVLREFEKEVSK